MDRTINTDGLERTGLIVYNASTLEPIFKTRTTVPKSILVDGDNLIIRNQFPAQIELINLLNGEQKFVHSVSNIEGLIVNPTIENCSIFNDKIGGLILVSP